MRAFEKALTVVQNNVTNASTPGYAKQRINLQALPFQPELCLPGGVLANGLISARAEYAEEAVWQQAARYGRFSEQSATLAQVEPIFDITQESGIAAAIDRLYQSFSQLSVTPNDIPARQSVINSAQDLAQSFNFSAASLFRVSQHVDGEIRSVVDAINRLGQNLQEINLELRQDYRKQQDAGLDTRLHATLEELAELVDFKTLRQEDGTITVLLGGQTPLVMGANLYEIHGDFSGSEVQILDYDGKVITSQMQQGRLSALLDMRNNAIPSYTADLDRLAAALADKVNSALLEGVDVNGQPPAVDLFSYDADNGAALTLTITDIAPEDLAAALPEAPGGNGNALKLAALATSREIDGFTFTEYYGQLGGRVGQALSSAQQDERTQSLLLAQARSLRAEISSVSLDEEAAILIQFQRAYQASAQLISVLNDLTDTLLSILH